MIKYFLEETKRMKMSLIYDSILKALFVYLFLLLFKNNFDINGLGYYDI